MNERVTKLYNPLQAVWENLAPLPLMKTLLNDHSNEASDFESYRSDGILAFKKILNQFEPYLVPEIEPELVATVARLLVNTQRLAKENPWRLVAIIDQAGEVNYQNFYSLWPADSDLSIEVLAALLNSPVASAYLSTVAGQQESNLLEVIKQIPVPRFNTNQIQELTGLVQKYCLYRRQWLRQPDQESHYQKNCQQLLWQIDAEVLKAYYLSPRNERLLLDYFAGHKRPGPVNFTGYYPVEFKAAIPWHLFISQEFKEAGVQPTLARLIPIDDLAISKMVVDLDRY